LSTFYRRVHARTSLAELVVLGERLVARWWLVGALRGPGKRLLSVALGLRYERDGDAEDLRRAVATARSAVAAAPRFAPRRPAYLHLLGRHLHTLSTATDDDGIRAEAVTVLRTAVAAARPGTRPSVEQDLCTALADRYRRTGNRSDLGEAVALARRMEASTPIGALEHAAHRTALADVLAARYELDGDATDYTEAIRLWQDAANTENAMTLDRLRAATRWGRCAADHDDWAEAAAGLRLAVELLPKAAWRGIARQDQRWLLRDWADLPVDAAAACLAIGDPEAAVRLLEHGRTIMWSQVATLRGTSPAIVAASNPAVLARLNEIRALLDTPADGRPEDAEQRTRLSREFDALLADNGLLQPTSFAELRRVASRGPVVMVNIGRYRSDALIITEQSGVRVVGLAPGCHHDLGGWLDRIEKSAMADAGDAVGRINANQVLRAALAWLWDDIVGPVLDVLGPVGRIWWCPTGLLARLPLHAAGHHGPGDGRTALDTAVSSYTLSLSALATARRRPRVDPGSDRLLLVVLPHTPGQKDLPQARVEAERIRAIVPGRYDVLTDVEATVDAVSKGLPWHAYSHFACHGRQVAADPSAGGIMLYDGALSPWALADLPLRSAEFAFLSACDTAVGDADVANEAVHPAAVLFAAGFRHVIASLGALYDKHSVDLSTAVYDTLRDGTGLDADRAAFALHEATKALRDAYPGTPTIWARHIHLGP
jgi:hypothetical protein